MIRCGKVLCFMTQNHLGIGRYLLVVIAVCWFTSPASASDTRHSAVAMHLLRAGTAAVADLDGDQIPDVASGISTGHTSEGYSYRVDFDFSGNPEAKPFSVFSEDSAGLNIEAVDIDGDHDLDLVIRGGLSARPLSVWLNDGRGRFTQGDLSNYTLVTWQTRSALQSPDATSNVVLHFQWRRPQMAGNRQRVNFRSIDSSFGEPHFSSPSVFQSSIGSARFRAPPVPSI
jgi:hypothetical protein